MSNSCLSLTNNNRWSSADCGIIRFITCLGQVNLSGLIAGSESSRIFNDRSGHLNLDETCLSIHEGDFLTRNGWNFRNWAKWCRSWVDQSFDRGGLRGWGSVEINGSRHNRFNDRGSCIHLSICRARSSPTAQFSLYSCCQTSRDDKKLGMTENWDTMLQTLLASEESSSILLHDRL